MRPDEHASAILLPLVFRLTGRPFASMSRELRAAEVLSADALQALQFERLTALLEHCYTNVPHYRAMFDRLDAKPSDIRTLADYAKLPTLDKATMRAESESLIVEDRSRADLVTVFTGGSTGVPVRLLQDRHFRDWNWSVYLRNLSWTGFHEGERQYWLQRPGAMGVGRRVRLALERKRLEAVVLLSDTAAAEWADRIRRFEPRLVVANPSTLSAIATHVLENDIVIDGIREIVASSETLSDHQRDLIARGLGAPVFNQYGSTETGGISSECACGNMHVNTDSVLLEYGESADPGSGSREAIVTPLMSYGMPLLRFRTGDRIGPAPERCTCGLPFPITGQPEGRVSDRLTFADGSVVSFAALERTLRAIPGVARFQFRQTSPDRLELAIIRNGAFSASTETRLEDIRRRFAEGSQAHIRVDLLYVDEIALTPAGKHRSVIPLP